MGLETNSNGGGRKTDYFKINLATGALVESRKTDRVGESGKAIYEKIVHEPGSRLTGILDKIKFEDNMKDGEKEGESVRLILRDVEEGKPDMSVEVSVSNPSGPTMNGLKLLAKIMATPDLDKPVTISPYFIAKGTPSKDPKYGPAAMDNMGITLYQDGQSIKEDFGDGVTQLPKLEPVMVLKGGVPVPLLVNGKEAKDKQPWVDLLEKMKSVLTPDADSQSQGHNEGIDPSEVAAATAQPRG